MSTTLEQRISAIQSKADLLLQRYKLISSQRDEAQKKLAQALDELTKMKAENERLKSELNYMKITSTFAPSGDDIRRSREFLSELVWEIDKCIKQLSE